MPQQVRLFRVERPYRPLSWRDGVVLVALLSLLYSGIRLAFRAPAEFVGPTINLEPRALPGYALLSLARMVAAYVLSLAFTLVYGYQAVNSLRARKILLPLLDVLQSVPILSFLPVVLLGLSAFLPQGIAAEIASVVLIFTSQVWNLTFGWYQSLTTRPKELREASTIFRLGPWLRFKTLDLPFATLSLLWNSMMSWAGGWFFLMAAEIFTVGERDFRLPGLGAYLQEAASQGDFRAIVWGLGTLVFVIVALDQLVWRPLLAWSERFKLEMVESDNPPTSWFYNVVRSSALLGALTGQIFRPWSERFDGWLGRRFPPRTASKAPPVWLMWLSRILLLALAGGLLYEAVQAGAMLVTLPSSQWLAIGGGILATLIRVTITLMVALLWTIPVGVAIGTQPKVAAILQPVVQIAASIPATALFPVFLLLLLGLPGGLNLAAIVLMLMGTQWYLLFNIIAGAAAIPKDLVHTTDLLQLRRGARWRTLILPALFPYIVTGLITASGGAWNASIVAEYLEFGGEIFSSIGIGQLIAQATAAGDYPLLLASTLAMVLVVVMINRLVWQRMYRLAEEKYRME
jgi:NitT/TauT family transport system permease protein